jgi:hypothetical protein
MSLFKPAENNAAYLKAAFMGLAGSGKTYTASELAIGMVKHMQKLGLPQGKKPVYFVDSEGGASWMVARFKEAGVPLQVASTTAFADLAQAMTIARDEACVLIIDSITAFWVEFTETYKETKGRKRGLEFQDWGWLKNEWRKKFTTRFLNDPVHTIMCGRMGFEYEHYTDDAGKRQIEKTGVKLKAESELGFEPSLLVQMERDQDINEREINHVAHILKDRRPDAKSLDGKSFKNPTFASFLPHIEYLNLGGKQAAFDENATSAAMIPDDPQRDNYGVRREIVVDEIDALLLKYGLAGTSNEAKTKRGELIEKHFKCNSRTEIEKLMSLDDLRQNFDSLHQELTGKPSRYAKETVPEIVDEIPFLEPKPETVAQPATEATVAAEPSDLDIVIRDFEAAVAKEANASKRKALWEDTAKAREKMDEKQLERIKVAYGKALMSGKGVPARGKARQEAVAAE